FSPKLNSYKMEKDVRRKSRTGKWGKISPYVLTEPATIQRMPGMTAATARTMGLVIIWQWKGERSEDEDNSFNRGSCPDAG
ncbi:MAG: hypothetical protein KAQ71_01825, partial [Desulfobulbaceae bacterium]|nr:hypothetical protein [Desulfobulbaceae bacterium]